MPVVNCHSHCVTTSKHLNQTRLPFFDSLFFDWTAGDWESRPFDAVLWHLTTLLLGLLKRKSGQRLNTILNHSLWWRNRAGWGQGARSITYSRDASQVAESRVLILDEYGIFSPFISEITKKTYEIDIFFIIFRDSSQNIIRISLAPWPWPRQVIDDSLLCNLSPRCFCDSEHAQLFVAKYKIPLTARNIGKTVFASSALAYKNFFHSWFPPLLGRYLFTDQDTPEGLIPKMIVPVMGKDPRWLLVEVCREFQRGKCSRTEDECRFAHPPAHVLIQNGKVTACFDSLKVSTFFS